MAFELGRIGTLHALLLRNVREWEWPSQTWIVFIIRTETMRSGPSNSGYLSITPTNRASPAKAAPAAPATHLKTTHPLTPLALPQFSRGFSAGSERDHYGDPGS